MRIESSVTSVSWIPSEAVSGLMKAGFTAGVAHYDDPPPDVLTDVSDLHAAERFRFANHLAAWIEVRDGEVTGTGYSGRGYITRTRLRAAGLREVTFQPIEFPEIKAAPEITATPEIATTGARFTQTTGGRTGAPIPRAVRGRPFFQWAAPIVWTTLTLTIGTDGSSHGDMTGASPFPRHWIYDRHGRLVAKSGLASFRDWSRTAFGLRTPWGEEDSKPLVTVAESALERQLAATIMRGGAKPAIRKLAKGGLLAEQGEPGNDIYLLLDGVLSVWVDGSELGELGPGAVVGERALLEHGRRTATLRAVTDCVVAIAAKDKIDRDRLVSLAEQHHREDLDG